MQIHHHSFKHGLIHSKEYRSWNNMKNRCLNQKYFKWKDYGGRGIKVCERWLNFKNFYADMGAKPSPKHSINRINNDGDYCPENCVWSTAREQCSNRRTNHLITVNGTTKTLTNWERDMGFKKNTISNRIRNGWDELKAVLTPIDFTKQH